MEHSTDPGCLETGCDPQQPPSLSQFLEELVTEHTDRVALQWGATAIGFGALLDESRRVADGLAALGVARGDRVAVWMPNAPAWLALLFACSRLGAILVAVNTRFRSAELGDILGRSGAKILVLWPGFKGIDFVGILEAVEPALRASLRTMILYSDGTSACQDGRIDYDSIAYAELAGRPPLTADFADPEAGSILFTTSGTTKRPKFVLHSHRSIISHARLTAAAYNYYAETSVTLLALPLCGIFGFAQAMTSLASGRPMIMQASFDAEHAAALIRRHSVTTFFASDDMVAQILSTTDDPAPFPTLEWIGFGAFNPMLAELPRQAEARGIRLVGIYGASEMQAFFARQPIGAPLPDRARGGGFAASPTAAMRVRDVTTGGILPFGESGELELKGPSLMVGYYGDEQATRAAFTDDGYFRTGDLAHLLPDGRVIFEERMSDVLRLGGYLVAPSEIEAYVQQHPAIECCRIVSAVVEHGVVAVGFVTLRAGESFDEAVLREFCARGLAGFKVPAAFFCVDAFPTTSSANGTKVQRARLREMAAARLSVRPVFRTRSG